MQLKSREFAPEPPQVPTLRAWSRLAVSFTLALATCLAISQHAEAAEFDLSAVRSEISAVCAMGDQADSWFTAKKRALIGAKVCSELNSLPTGEVSGFTSRLEMMLTFMSPTEVRSATAAAIEAAMDLNLMDLLTSDLSFNIGKANGYFCRRMITKKHQGGEPPDFLTLVVELERKLNADSEFVAQNGEIQLTKNGKVDFAAAMRWLAGIKTPQVGYFLARAESGDPSLLASR
jgi:hypothetical protein